MAVKTYLQAISDGLRQEMQRDKRVYVIGEDVGVYGGAFKVTQGFQDEFGPWRVIDAPLSETAIVGSCTGAAIMGMRPVAEMQFADFVSCAWDHLVTVAAKQFYRVGTAIPIVVRCPSGGGFSGGPFHSQNPESSFAHIPGLKVVCPATPADAKGLLIGAIEDANPVLYFEHKHLYRRIKDEVPDERYTVPFGRARIHREGDDVTVVTWGAMVYTADEAAKQLEDELSVEILDLRTDHPVGQGGGAEVRGEDLEGARPARGHSNRRLRRRDRGHDHRGGLRDPRCARQADRRTRLARPVLAAPREGLHPAGRGRRHRAQGSGGVLMATGTAVDVVMPQMGVSVSEGTITKWLKQPGETVEADEPLLEISTDKVDTEVPSPASGVVREVLVQEGETVDVGTKLAVIAPEGSDNGAAPAAAETPPEPATAEAAAESEAASGAEGETATAETAASAEPAPPEPAAPAQPAQPAPSEDGQGDGKAFVSPVVGRIAAEHGVDVSQVTGTGRGGRVTKKDIMGFIEGGAQAAPPKPAEPEAPAPAEAEPAPPPAAAAPTAPAPEPAPTAELQPGEQTEPVTAMRRGIANHMRRSLDTSAHVTSAIEVDMSKVVEIRKKLKSEYQSKYGVNPTYLSFVARAATETLMEYPWINGELRGDTIVTRPFVNLGFAVELADGKGLIVPVVKNAETLNLLGLAKAVTDIAERARNKQLLPDEVQGGTFTITNPGGYGTFHGTPVISQPQSGILGTYAVVKRPWVVQDELGQDVIAIRPIMNVTLTYDHRLVDGAYAGRFLRDLKQRLETWDESSY